MIQSELTLRYTGLRQRETVAWLLTGSDPARWLAELAGWQVELLQICLRPLPGDQSSQGLSGVLVTVAGESRPRVQYCAEYGCLADRFFLPVEARLEPALSEAELVQLLQGHDDDLVFHPVLGLVRISRQERLEVVDLLTPPTVIAVDWGFAQPGTAPLRPLVSVEPDSLPTVEQVLREGGEDIGIDDPSQIPWRSHSPRGERSGLAELGNTVRGFLAAAGDWLARLRSAAGSQAGQAAVQNRELDRLVDLLNRDPDEGLRYAMPLTAAMHRGLAPMGRLMRRVVDFNLGQLFGGGGGPASIWKVSHQRYRALNDCYRELANRELALGRHRRAAYIYAHLLGDFHAAAQTLRDGKHWREAAVLYRDKLNRLETAAECLVEGHLWAEAIEAYEQLKADEKVGDLYRQIGQEEAARQAYYRAIDKHWRKDDYVGAARLAREKLESPQEALQFLRAGWPASAQATLCLAQMFHLYAELGQHDESARTIDQIDPDHLSEHRAVKGVSVLVNVATEYPDAGIRARAADQVRVVCGQLLPQASSADISELTKYVRHVDPSDRLLARDGLQYRRFAQQHRQPAPVTSSSHHLRLIRAFNLDKHTSWSAAASSEAAAYIAGYQEASLRLQRIPFVATAADQLTLEWPIRPGLESAPLLICPDPQELLPLIIHVVGDTQQLQSAPLMPSDADPAPQAVSDSAVLSAHTRAVARARDALLWVVDQEDDRCVLRCHAPYGRLLHSSTVSLPEHLDPSRLQNSSIQLAATPTHVYLSVERTLICLQRGLRTDSVEFDSRITQLVVPPGEHSACVAVESEDQVNVVWHLRRHLRVEKISQHETQPCCGFTRDCRLVVLDGTHMVTYQPRNMSHVAGGGGAFGVTQPLRILAAVAPGQFLLCCRGGRTDLLELA